MGRWDEQIRRMYAGQRGNTTARRFARFWAKVYSWGLFPRRWVTLEVPGRKSGKPTRFPLGMTDVDGQWYLVSMLGQNFHWVRNVRANGGRAVLERRHRREVLLNEVPVEERAPIIKRYLQQVPGGRPHIPVDRRAPFADFEAIAAAYPVFVIAPV